MPCLTYGVSVGKGNRKSHVVVHGDLTKGRLLNVIDIYKAVVIYRADLREDIALIIEVYYVIENAGYAVSCEMNFKFGADSFNTDDIVPMGIDGLIFATKFYGRLAVYSKLCNLINDGSDLSHFDRLFKKHDVRSCDAFFFHQGFVVDGGRAHYDGTLDTCIEKHLQDIKAVALIVVHIDKKTLIHLRILHEGLYITEGINPDSLTGFLKVSVGLAPQKALCLLSVSYIVITNGYMHRIPLLHKVKFYRTKIKKNYKCNL